MAPDSPALAEYRAGGTDLSERRRTGVSRGALREVAAPVGFHRETDGGLRIGALTSVAALASDPALAHDYPGLAAAAAGLATPQIRRMATLGGNIAQRNRCSYFRNPDIACLKKGGASCPARAGDALHGVVFDTAPCVAPHPSTLAAALVAYDARLDTDQRRNLPIADALGDGRAAGAETALAPGELITSILLPPPVAGERAAYKRAIARAHAEWPLVELVVIAAFEGAAFTRLRVVAGGVAPVPLRLLGVENVAQASRVSEASLAVAAAAAGEGANPLPATRYKLDLLKGLVHDLLQDVASDALELSQAHP